MYRPRIGILRAKQLKKLKLKKEFRVVTRFAKRNIKNIIRQQLNDTL